MSFMLAREGMAYSPALNSPALTAQAHAPAEQCRAVDDAGLFEGLARWRETPPPGGISTIVWPPAGAFGPGAANCVRSQNNGRWHQQCTGQEEQSGRAA